MSQSDRVSSFACISYLNSENQPMLGFLWLFTSEKAPHSYCMVLPLFGIFSALRFLGSKPASLLQLAATSNELIVH